MDEQQDVETITQLGLAYQVLSGGSVPEVAANHGVEPAELERWVELVNDSALLALRAAGAGLYMSGRFFQLARVVEKAGVWLRSLDRVECRQSVPDSEGVSEICGHIERIVDNIGSDDERETEPGAADALRFAFEGRCADGKATGSFWSCVNDHESRGTFILNRYNVPGHALAGSYAKMEFDADKDGRIVSVPSVAVQRQVIWSHYNPGDSWRDYLEEAKRSLSIPGPRRFGQFGELVDLATERLRPRRSRNAGSGAVADDGEEGSAL